MDGLDMTFQRHTMPFGGVYAGARVLVTGHTGFKGSWLCEWLLSLGAQITGFALEPETTPALFSQLGLANRLDHIVGDIRDSEKVAALVSRCQPDFVFHMAAQPLVRRSYAEPTYTWETNVLGSVHVLNAVRSLAKHCACVMVTTDKCYENREWLYGYRENDPLGGHDPYSSSKAAAELAISSWNRSFFTHGQPVRVASARAGNVIGGGDWAADRIVPDAMRALANNQPILVRNPSATRPWQHVLEPNSGYLAIAAALKTEPDNKGLASAFNIGPNHDANQPVRKLVATILQHWPGTWDDAATQHAPHEASLLQLDNGKIRSLLGWRPTWSFDEAVSKTVAWYRCVATHGQQEARSRTLADIQAYEFAARAAGNPWAASSPND